MSIDIEPVPAFQDNYLWVMFKRSDGTAIVVDPGDAEPVERFLRANQLHLEAILITHHHPDHVGGIKPLVSAFHCPVFGPMGQRFPSVTEPLADGHQVHLLGCNFDVISTPGHTLDHLCYFSADPALGDHPVLFAGDTLFAGGCGRLFEGTPAQMLDSLTKLSNLPSNTLLFCAHEYTMANLRFAKAVEPDNLALRERFHLCQALRERHLPTLPSTLEEECQTNPFLRASEVSVKAAARHKLGHAPLDAVETFAAIRLWKDNF